MEQNDMCENCTRFNKEYLCDYYVNGIANTTFSCDIDGEDDITKLCLEMAKNTSIFIDELGYNDILSIFYLYQMMRDLGAFGVGSGFSFNTAPYDYRGLFYTRMMAGVGCCRNICDFLRIIFNQMDGKYNSFLLRGYIGIENLKSFNTEELTFSKKLEKLIDYFSLFVPKGYGVIGYQFGNHSNLFISDGDKKIVLDPTNNYVFNYNGTSICPVVGTSGKFKICGALLNELDFVTQESTIELMDMFKGRGYTLEEVESIYNEVVPFINDNKDLIYDFKRDNEKISKECYRLLVERKSLHR